MSAWGGMNRRQFPRINFPCMVKLKHGTSAQEVILTHTENIGIGGVCVSLKMNLKMFAPIDLEIDLLDGSNHIKCAGKVVWSIRRKINEATRVLFYDIGIEFEDIAPKDKARIEDALQKFLQKGHSASNK